MAAGTEISQPVSALDENQALDAPHRYSSGNGLPDNDDAQCVSEAEKGGREFVGRPPRPGLAPIRHCISVARSVCPSDSVESIGKNLTFSEPLAPDGMTFKPVVRSGGWSDIGLRSDMEDAHVCIDDLESYLGCVIAMERPGAFYGVFDGHGGKVAAQFVKENMLKFIVKDVSFPSSIEEAMHHAFLQTDVAFAEACSADQSGTTAITVLVLGRALVVANLGDCRAVLCKRGKAMEMSRDHKPGCVVERERIESLGGFVDDGYLNGQLAVARALGDWHMKGVKGIGCPLSAEPELQQTILTEEDEFLIIGCDGLWDVFTSQNAVDFARRRLQQHNDPERCSRELVAEALRRDTRDNLTVVTVCFQEDPPPRLFSKFQIRRSISADGLRNLQELLDTGF